MAEGNEILASSTWGEQADRVPMTQFGWTTGGTVLQVARQPRLGYGPCSSYRTMEKEVQVRGRGQWLKRGLASMATWWRGK